MRQLLTLTMIAILFASAPLQGAEGDHKQRRQQAVTHFNNGNYADALTIFQQLIKNPESPAAISIAEDLRYAVNSLNALNRSHETDALIEDTLSQYRTNWVVLKQAAELYRQANHWGYLIGGKYERGHHRGGGKYVTSFERDRVRALQLFYQAIVQATLQRANAGEQANLRIQFAQTFQSQYQGNQHWPLQRLTDLEILPDYAENSYYRYGKLSSGTPATDKGDPVYFHKPESFDVARNDAERWRWLMEQAAKLSPNSAQEVTYHKAVLFNQLYGVITLARDLTLFQYGYGDNNKEPVTKAYAVRTLKDDETLVRLATGIKRFNLPDEFNHIKLFQAIINNPEHNHRILAFNSLGQIFENRQQYTKAADVWSTALETSPNNKNFQKHLQQITGNWGRFEPTRPAATGQTLALSYRYRNSTNVTFKAQRIDVKRLLKDVKDYTQSGSGNLDYEKINISRLGHRLVVNNEKKYLAKTVAQWQLPLVAPPDHFDSRINIDIPIEEAGAYLLTASMKDGNKSHIVVWINDTIIVRKLLGKQMLYYVADAKTGQPLKNIKLDFFAYARVREKMPSPLKNTVYRTKIKRFTKESDNDGMVIINSEQDANSYSWLVTAMGEKKHFAYLGFDNLWFSNHQPQRYEQTKYLTITDRPVYRPNQTVKYKLWLRTATYGDDKLTSRFANQSHTLRITNPKNETLVEKRVTLDAYGSVQGEYELPDDAALGIYRVQLTGFRYQSANTFRVEEYKKPEFEVTIDTPDKPVKLGDEIQIDIKANYYFGAPVAHGKVKYKVLRYSETNSWYPQTQWDWLYGNGYWWPAYDATWYPDWHQWGLGKRHGYWLPYSTEPPELVAEQELPISGDGKLSFTLDTTLAKALHGDKDHRYEITAEVTDNSRRTIVGSGSVLISSKPFKLTTWVDKGYYHSNDTVTAKIKAQTAQQKPIQAEGSAQLFKIHYGSDGEPNETLVQEWSLHTDARGEAQQAFRPGSSGQYRFLFRLEDKTGHEEQSAYLFQLIDNDKDSDNFRFNAIELLTDQREYRPGENVKLRINTEQADSHVLLFIRPGINTYQAPQPLQLKHKSALQTIVVGKADMPNFFVEALTVRNGQVYTEVKEIIVPPEKRTLNVELSPDQTDVKPGASIKLNVKVTDTQGNPVRGSTVISIYDKSIEYIAGGSNVPELRRYFWQWRQEHSAHQSTNADRGTDVVYANQDQFMGSIGLMGTLLHEEYDTYNPANRGSVAFSMAKQESVGIAAQGFSAGVAMDKNYRSKKRQMAAPPQPLHSNTITPTVRKQFADTAYWNAIVELDKNGIGRLTIPMPENLTTWKIKAWSMAHGTRVGEGSTEVITKKNLLVRLQAPRFFVEKDEVVLSANIHNYLSSKKSVTAKLEFDGDQLTPLDNSVRTIPVKTIKVAANGEARVDWRVKVNREGEAVVRMLALTDEESDAMEMRFPVYVHGMLKTESFTGSLSDKAQHKSLTIDVPPDRRVEQTLLELRYSPSLAAAMIDALPYLVDYPYGCTEQTLSRFLPTVITQNVLKRMKLDLKMIRDKRTNLNAQEMGDAKQRAQQWSQSSQQSHPYPSNPVFDEAEVTTMARQGLQRLEAMQVSDGGWGWFSGWNEKSYPHTTAHVVHGLLLAKANGLKVNEESLSQGIQWLQSYQVKQLDKLLKTSKQGKPIQERTNNVDALVYMVLSKVNKNKDAMGRYLYRDRNLLSVYGKAMFGLALEKAKKTEQLNMILKNIEQYLVMDEENETAYLNLPNQNYWWNWYGSEIEAHAYYLKLLTMTQPRSKKAAWLVKYLLNNRKHASYWNSTRDTAIVVEAFADYLQKTQELTPDMQLDILVDGELKKQVVINKDNLLTFDNVLQLQGSALSSGKHKIEIRKRGSGVLYFNTYLRYFSLEDYIKKAGLELKVERNYYKLLKQKTSKAVAGSRGQAVDQAVEKYRRLPINNLGEVNSGDLVEVELLIQSKNDYEYLIFEDRKAAGFEPVDVRSGYTGNELGAYVEFRDESVNFFVRQLARGKHSVSYRLRAEIPGKFSALPAKGYAMYAPEIQGNSDEIKLTIVD